MALKDDLTEIAENVTGAEGVGIYWLSYQNSQQAPRLQVLIEKEGGVSVDDCARVSRALASKLEEELDREFELEVSSPGLERPLFTLKHYEAAIGENIRVKTFGPIEGNKIWDGKLLKAGDSSISVETDGGSQEIGLELIAQAQVSPDFDLS
jgi:ribosome maturation factor RimP